jgi:hypothetical protein
MNFDHAIVSAALKTSCITESGQDLAFVSRSQSTYKITYLRNMGDTFQCLLCNVAGMSWEDLTSRHIYGDKHIGCLLNLKDDIERIEISSERFCSLFSKPVHQTIELLDQMIGEIQLNRNCSAI